MPDKGRTPRGAVLSTIEPFSFYPQELKTLHRRLCLSLRFYEKQQLEAHGMTHRPEEWDAGYDLGKRKWIWDMIRGVIKGRANSNIAVSVLDEVYASAIVAYDNALHHGGSEAQARAAAVLWAQLPLEKQLFSEIGECEHD